MFWLWMILWAVVGLLLGTQVNRFVFDWSVDRKYSPSPYSIAKRPYKPVFTDYIPIFGWLGLRGRVEEFKGLFWLRPVFLEAFCGICLPLLFWYYMSGGPIGGTVTGPFDSTTPFGTNNLLPLLSGGTQTLWVWFLLHSAMFFLMTIATVIDFDERLIPDQITLPGLLIAVIAITAWPNAAMPTIQYTGVVPSIAPLHFFSPSEIPTWTLESWSPLVVIGCWAIWGVLVSLWYYPEEASFSRKFKFAIASFLQPKRKSGGRKRSMHVFNKIVALVILAATIATLVIYFFVPSRWEAFFSVSVAMTLAGLGGFGVRFLAQWALNQEAFGLGDVILLFMVGAAFGWQAALVIFVVSSILGLFFAIWTLIVWKEGGLAFGPWICIASVIVVVGWPAVWTGWAEKQIFILGPEFVLGLVAACLVLLPILLIAIGYAKQLLGLDTYQEL